MFVWLSWWLWDALWTHNVVAHTGCHLNPKSSINTLSYHLFSIVLHFYKLFMVLALWMCSLSKVIFMGRSLEIPLCVFKFKKDKKYITSKQSHIFQIYYKSNFTVKAKCETVVDHTVRACFSDSVTMSCSVNKTSDDGCISNFFFMARPQVLPASHMNTHGSAVCWHRHNGHERRAKMCKCIQVCMHEDWSIRG